MSLTLDQLNTAAPHEALALLAGVYEHSPWVVKQALAQRPFKSLAHLKYVLALAVREADADHQLALLRAHPELAGKLAEAGQLTAESTHEQATAGLQACSPEELAALQRLNAEYQAKFGWPFILAVRGPRGTGLTRAEIIATFARRLEQHAEVERAECLRNIHRIAELRLNDKFGIEPTLGHQVWDCAELLARHSDVEGALTVTYLTPAHLACQHQLAQWMRECGFDEVEVDAVGNVVGVYHGTQEDSPRLLTGSHYDTVRNGGRYDGRLGIFVPMVAVRELHRQSRRPPFDLEVIAFAEEEGQRYKATFLGSSAVTGRFDAAWLDQRDAEGVPMREAMAAAGLEPKRIAWMQRHPTRYLGFVEVHIEQGPVLNELDLPLGVVTSINGSVRYLGEMVGVASHAGTTPMDRRRDAAAGAAELLLYVERRAQQAPHLVGTVGLLDVPAGSINVVPGRCRFSLDIRATTDDARDAMLRDVLAEIRAITERRGLHCTLEETLRAAAAPSAPDWQARWERAVASLGLPVYRMPSGAGHDAMKLHEVMPQAMLFVRGGNNGISHNPLETITSDDAQLCVQAFQQLLDDLAGQQP
ncbi:MAG: 2-oxo-4-hydroxy-4-carboxy-5-ureidoimidazoline decarboxylase [Rhizobacter sp.]|nr:2-oxo-4-hydroxy-4-carboxy-5-ureidoimidazoline decarboxylase [Rhizobacter sp.]